MRPASAAGLRGLVLLLAACAATPTGGDRGDAADAAPTAPGTLEIDPVTASLAIVDGVPASQAFTVRLRGADGSVVDVSDEAQLAIDPAVATVSGATVIATGDVAGVRTLRARARGMEAEATLTVTVERQRLLPGAPADAAAQLAAAADDATRAPTLLYPTDATLVPPNLGSLDVQWKDDHGHDLFEVTLTSPLVTLRLYTPRTQPASVITLQGDDWRLLAESHRGDEVVVRVRGVTRGTTPVGGTSITARLAFAPDDVAGGLYYWSTTREGLYRHDFGDPAQVGTLATPWYGKPQAGRCLGCHALSRDGRRAFVTYEGQGGPAVVLDVATSTPLFAATVLRADFAAFAPDGEAFVAATGGELTWRASATGALLATIPTGAGLATHPDVSPAGDRLLWVRRDGGNDVFPGGQGDKGSLWIQPFDAASGLAGAPVLLVDPPDNRRVCYPSFSPDGAWVLYDLGDGDCYDDGGAQLFVVPADGSRPPQRLTAADLGPDLTNSWARWAPFVQTGATGEPLYWFTVSSKRAYGVRKDKGRPQLWMGAFEPARATTGADGSRPMFWLPVQDLDSANHIAQWTEQIVEVD